MGINKKFLLKLLSGLSDKNIKFRNLRKLMIDLGFKERIKGDHHIFIKADVLEILNRQPLKDGKAKPYQVKLKYKLHKEVLRDV